MGTGLVSPDSILRKLYLYSSLNVRQLAALHDIDASNKTLVTAVADLKRRGQIRSIGGRGRHTAFVPATYDI